MKHMNKHWIKAALLAAGVLVGNAAWAQASCSDGGIPFSGGPMAGLCSNGSPPQAGGGGGGRSGGYVPPTVIHLPTSYGAVAWDGKTNTYGYSSKQASKQASKPRWRIVVHEGVKLLTGTPTHVQRLPLVIQIKRGGSRIKVL